MTEAASTADAGTNHLALAADIIAAYVSNNSLQAADLPKLLADVHGKIATLAAGVVPKEPEKAQEPAVSVKKSITPDFLICLEDGKKFKSLKRHLGTTYSLTPDQYRAKWNLPSDYPMVAPAYSAKRSELAKSIGLGTGNIATLKVAAKTVAPTAVKKSKAPKKKAA